ncbi:MAG: response regulator [Motiliproteus sp.]
MTDGNDRVLVVDDSLTVRMVISLRLEAVGAQVLVAASGEEALEIIETTAPDLILLDINMQGLDGYEVCNRIQANPARRDIPVIFLTAHDDIENTLKGYQCGAVDYISKLSKMADLEARVNVHLRIRRLQSENKFKTIALEQKNIELEKSLKALKDLQAQLVHNEKMVSLGTLSAGIAHEINNPLGYISSNISSLNIYIQQLMSLIGLYEKAESAIANQELLAEIVALKNKIDLSYLKVDLVDIVTETADGALRVKNIVQALKDFNHADQGEKIWSDLHHGIKNTLLMIQNEIQDRIAVVTDLGEIPLVSIVPSQINQVILNVILNGIQSIEQQGKLTIRTGLEEGRVWLDIEDSGCGIADADQERIFEPFYTTKPVGQGAGLGLSHAYGIVQDHGGSIEVRSDPGVGSQFKIWLPVT